MLAYTTKKTTSQTKRGHAIVPVTFNRDEALRWGLRDVDRADDPRVYDHGGRSKRASAIAVTLWVDDQGNELECHSWFSSQPLVDLALDPKQWLRKKIRRAWFLVVPDGAEVPEIGELAFERYEIAAATKKRATARKSSSSKKSKRVRVFDRYAVQPFCATLAVKGLSFDEAKSITNKLAANGFVTKIDLNRAAPITEKTIKRGMLNGSKFVAGTLPKNCFQPVELLKRDEEIVNNYLEEIRNER